MAFPQGGGDGAVGGAGAQQLMGEESMFRAWFRESQERGGIPPGADMADHVEHYCQQRMRLGLGEGREQEDRRIKREEKLRDRSLRALQGFGRAVSVIDGADRGALRAWLETIRQAGDVARAIDEDILQFALSNARGNLYQVIYASWKEDRTRPWEEVMRVVAATLLSADEVNYLREQVKALAQLPGESEPCYSQRFWDAARNAWPAGDLAGDSTVLQMLLCIFMDSLRDQTTRWYLQVHQPATIMDAVALASKSGRAMENRQRRLGTHEPMELGAVGVARSQKDTGRDSECLQVLKSLQGEVKSLRKMVICPQEGVGSAQVNNSGEGGLYQAAVAAAHTAPVRTGAQGAGGLPPTQGGGGEVTQGQQAQRRVMGRGESVNKPVSCFFCGGDHFVRHCEKKRRWVMERGDQGRPAPMYSGN